MFNFDIQQAIDFRILRMFFVVAAVSLVVIFMASLRRS
jgi:hypothetical protein